MPSAREGREVFGDTPVARNFFESWFLVVGKEEAAVVRVHTVQASLATGEVSVDGLPHQI